MAYRWNGNDPNNNSTKSSKLLKLIVLLALVCMASVIALGSLPIVLSYPITLSLFGVYCCWPLARYFHSKYQSNRNGSDTASSSISLFQRIKRKGHKDSLTIGGYICIVCGTCHNLRACPICHSKIKKPWFR